MIYYYKAHSTNIDDSCSLWKWTAFTTLIGSSFCENFQLITLYKSHTHVHSERQNGYEGFIKTRNDVKSFRKETSTEKIAPIIYLKASDTITASVCADFIRAIAPNALTVGNHNFNDGIANLSNYLRICGHLVVCANCNFRHEATPSELTKPPHVSAVNGRKIGNIVYLTTITNDEDEFSCVKNEAECLDKGVGALIALEHFGFDMIKEICKNITEHDFMVGEHTNGLLWHDAFIIAHSKDNPEDHYLTMMEQPGKLLLTAIFYELSGLLKAEYMDSYFVFLSVTFPEDHYILRLPKKCEPQVDLMKEHILDFTEIELLIWTCRTEECDMPIVTNALINYNIRMGVWTNCFTAIVNGVTLKNRHHSVIEEGYETQIVQRCAQYRENITTEVEPRISRTKPDVRSTCVLSQGSRLKLFCIFALYLATFVFLAAFCVTPQI